MTYGPSACGGTPGGLVVTSVRGLVDDLHSGAGTKIEKLSRHPGEV